MRVFLFPLCFFLVAVPWPYAIENLVIQGLTRVNTVLTIEIIGGLGVPAIQHGNVIELAAGSVGIDEACSGIRSSQATLMLSLFFAELYSLSTLRRALCVLTGFAIAMVCNLGRMLLLTWVAARKGEQAIAGWHDPAGVTILLLCFIGVWFFATRQPPAQGRKRDHRVADIAPSASSRQPADLGQPLLSVPPPRRSHLSLRAFYIALAVWLVLVEVGVAAWYHHVESGARDSATWDVVWPEDRIGFRDVPMPARATEMLRYDEARQAQWSEADGSRWQLSWFYWKPGQAAGYLAKSHSPLVCMPAAGYGVVSTSTAQELAVGGLRFPYRIYSFEQAGARVHVLYSRWDDRAKEQSFAAEGLSRLNRLRSVWAGRGNQGQRVITMALWSTLGEDEARLRLLGQLERLLVVEAVK